MNDHTDYDAEFEQLLRGLPTRQPSPLLDARIQATCRPTVRRARWLIPAALAAGLALAAFGLTRPQADNTGLLAHVETVPAPVAVVPQPGPSVRQVSVIASAASAANAFLPALTLLHCQVEEPAPGRRS